MLGWFWLIEILQVKYLNNMIEQDHRLITTLTRPIKGFKSFQSASATLDDIEVAHMIRKRQFAQWPIGATWQIGVWSFQHFCNHFWKDVPRRLSKRNPIHKAIFNRNIIARNKIRIDSGRAALPSLRPRDTQAIPPRLTNVTVATWRHGVGCYCQISSGQEAPRYYFAINYYNFASLH